MAVSELARALAAIARAGNVMTAHQMTVARFGESSKAAVLLKSAITTDTLSPDAAAFADFVGAAPSASILNLMNRVSPFRLTRPGTPILVDQSPPEAAWRIEASPIITTGANFQTVRLHGNKSIAGITFYTAEAGRELGENFTRQLGDDVVSAINYAESSALLDPANDGSGSAPASLTHDAVTVASSGADADAIRADLAALLSQYGGDLSRSVWAVSAATAVRLSLLGGSLGDSDVNVTGGFFAGLPLCAARGVPDNQLVLLDPSGIVLFDDGVRFDTSGETTLNTKNAGGDDEVVTLWAANLGALKFVRVLDWQAARPDCVAVLAGIPWTPTPPPPDAGKRQKVSRNGKSAP